MATSHSLGEALQGARSLAQVACSCSCCVPAAYLYYLGDLLRAFTRHTQAAPVACLKGSAQQGLGACRTASPAFLASSSRDVAVSLASFVSDVASAGARSKQLTDRHIALLCNEEVVSCFRSCCDFQQDVVGNDVCQQSLNRLCSSHPVLLAAFKPSSTIDNAVL